MNRTVWYSRKCKLVQQKWRITYRLDNYGHYLARTEMLRSPRQAVEHFVAQDTVECCQYVPAEQNAEQLHSYCAEI
jgi:hypothetical protein